MLIDYAHPMMMAEQHQRKAHDAFLEHKWSEGKEELILAIAELRIAALAAAHYEQQDKSKVQ